MMEIQIEKRGPGRPRVNPLPADGLTNGAEDHRARAAARLKEIEQDLDLAPERDRFWAPAPPDGWDYQWKRRTVLNKEDPSYQVELVRQGWEAVPLTRHPEMMPRGWAGNTIEFDGMILMERPKVLTDKARLRESTNARDAVRTKEAQLGLSSKTDLSYEKGKSVNITRSYEPVQIPADE